LEFFGFKTENSARKGFLFWNGPTLYGVKWHPYKVLFRLQTYQQNTGGGAPEVLAAVSRAESRDRRTSNPNRRTAS